MAVPSVSAVSRRRLGSAVPPSAPWIRRIPSAPWIRRILSAPWIRRIPSAPWIRRIPSALVMFRSKKKITSRTRAARIEDAGGAGARVVAGRRPKAPALRRAMCRTGRAETGAGQGT